MGFGVCGSVAYPLNAFRQLRAPCIRFVECVASSAARKHHADPQPNRDTLCDDDSMDPTYAPNLIIPGMHVSLVSGDGTDHSSEVIVLVELLKSSLADAWWNLRMYEIAKEIAADSWKYCGTNTESPTVPHGLARRAPFSAARIP